MPQLFDFAHYSVKKELGRGTTGTVYLAENNGQELAIKIIHESLSEDPVIKRRLRQELSLARELRHPRILKLWDLIEHDGMEAISMEYCPGGSLAEIIAASNKNAEPIPADKAEAWLKELLAALRHAHSHGWIHRAVKPENILVAGDGSVKLADFGSARFSNLSGLTTSTTFLATPLYIAPEILRGENCKPSHDLYSLGAIFYQLLGKKPHRDQSLRALIDRGNSAYLPLSRLRPDLPKYLASLVDALLSGPETRPGSALAALNILNAKEVLAEGEKKHCLFCHAAMPLDAPLCIECGELDIFPESYIEKDAEALMLKKLSEEAGVIERLYNFMEAWSGQNMDHIHFVTENKNLYGKAELKNMYALPIPLINFLSPQTAWAIIEILEKSSRAPLHLERNNTYQVAKKKKAPILLTLRPEKFRPMKGMLISMQKASGIKKTAQKPVQAAFLSDFVFDAQRLANLLKPYNPDAEKKLGHLIQYGIKMYKELGEIEAALASISLPELYMEESRLKNRLEDEATMPNSEWKSLKAQLEKNREVWQRWDKLEMSSAITANRLEELKSDLKKLLGDISRELEKHDPVAQSRALAGFEEFMRGSGNIQKP